MSVPALVVQQLTKTYANGFQALKGIDLSVKQGDFFALLGPNGAGKSTTLGILSGLVQKTSGSAAVMGFDVNSQAFEARRHLGVVPQEFNFNQFEKVEDILITQAGYFGLRPHEVKDRAKELLDALDLWQHRDKQSRMLSGGMKRRLMIARALIHSPKVLILDEPTAGVDIEIRRSMWEFMQQLNAQGTTIILTTHYLEEAEQLCRNIAIIDEGKIIQSSSMRALLGQLSTETFVFDLNTNIDDGFGLPGFSSKKIADDGLEITVNKGQSINQIFCMLTERNIEMRSMRTKSNRLEELFVSLVHGGKA